jgi:two-component system, OmpR family, sensor histidine kinase BaeS
MRLGITAKLFLGVLATSTLVAVVMAVAGQLGFQRDFRQYIEAAEARRSEALAETLAGLYAESGDWSALAGAERRWRAMLRSHARPPEGAAGEARGAAAGEARGRGGPRLALYDAGGALVVGNPGDGAEVSRYAVMFDGEPVGYLVRPRSRQPTETADLRFQRAQLRNLAIATVAAVLLAALAAALLSRAFLAPARALGDATHRLAAGDFEARARVRSADEFGQLADDFNLLARTLQRNEEMRRRMMADVAHELRTPLAVVHGELAAIKDGVRAFGPEILASLQAETRALGNLIDDLYQLSLSDLGALDYRRLDLDLRAQVAEALLPLNDRCAAAGLALDDSGVNGEPLPVHADPDRLGQLVANLVENALRYTDSPGRIEVACRRAGDRALLEVRDSAPGVPAELLPRLFERFFRAEHSRSRASGGAGLGLAICRNIVEAHDGTITAAPSPLGGLAITASLPLLRTRA